MERRAAKLFAIVILLACAMALALALVFICAPKAAPSETAYADGDYSPDDIVRIYVDNNTLGSDTGEVNEIVWGTFYYGLSFKWEEGLELWWYNGSTDGTVVFSVGTDVDGENGYLKFGISKINGESYSGRIDDTVLKIHGQSHDFTKGGGWQTSYTYYNKNGDEVTYESKIGHLAVCEDCGFMLEVPHRISDSEGNSGCLDCDIASGNKYSFTIPDNALDLDNDEEVDNNWDDSSGIATISFDIKVNHLKLFVGTTLTLNLICPNFTLPGDSSDANIAYKVSAESVLGTTSEIIDSGDDNEQVLWTFKASDYTDYMSDDGLWVGVNWNWLNDDVDSGDGFTITVTLTIENLDEAFYPGEYQTKLVFSVDDGSEAA